MDVYVLLKIFKLLFNVLLQSFYLKFAIDRSIPDVKYESGDLGELLERVSRFYTLRGKFEGIYDAQSCDED